MTSYKQRIEEILSKYQLYRSIMAEELLALMDEFGEEVIGRTTLETSGGHYTHQYPLNAQSSAEDALMQKQRTRKKELL